jgi:hypothetical protein
MKHTVLYLCILSLGLSSCHEALEPTPYTYTKLLTGEKSKTWALTLVEITSNGEVVERFALDNCTKDDGYVFHASSDRLYEVKSGSSKCYAEEPDTITDYWSFTNATATLTIILPVLSDNQLPFIVRKLDKDDLILEIFLDEEGIESYRIHFQLSDEE